MSDRYSLGEDLGGAAGPRGARGWSGYWHKNLSTTISLLHELARNVGEHTVTILAAVALGHRGQVEEDAGGWVVVLHEAQLELSLLCCECDRHCLCGDDDELRVIIDMNC